MANNVSIDGTLKIAGGMNFGDAVGDSVAFYGTAAGVTQRAGSNQASTNVVTSASFGTLQVAQLQEVYNTLAGLGLWKGSA